MNKLGSVWQIWLKQAQSRCLDPYSMFESLYENSVIDCIKCSSEIQQDQSRHKSILWSHENIISSYDELRKPLEALHSGSSLNFILGKSDEL